MSRKHMGSGDKLEQFWSSIAKEKLDTLKYCLLHSGINYPSMQNEKGWTCVMVCAFDDKPKALLIILDIMRQQRVIKESIDLADEDGRTALMMAAAKGNEKCVDHL